VLVIANAFLTKISALMGSAKIKIKFKVRIKIFIWFFLCRSLT
jgi:hypothetical protein